MIILVWVYRFILIMLAIKIVGNLVLPYSVLNRDDEEGVSIAFILIGDIFLALAVFIIALIIDRPGKIYDVGTILVWNCCAILGSYVHFFVVLSVASILRNRT